MGKISIILATLEEEKVYMMYTEKPKRDFGVACGVLLGILTGLNALKSVAGEGV